MKSENKRAILRFVLIISIVFFLLVCNQFMSSQTSQDQEEMSIQTAYEISISVIISIILLNEALFIILSNYKYAGEVRLFGMFIICLSYAPNYSRRPDFTNL